MAPVDFSMLARQCAPQVAPMTLAAIVRTESGFNPYAIGVVGGRLVRQPASAAEAVATARELERQGWNYSVGLAQVNRSNFSRYGLGPDTAFEPCRNVAAGVAILAGCFAKARTRSRDSQVALRNSLSCYTAGDFVTGYRTGYVQRVVDNAAMHAIPVVPAIDPRVTPIRVLPLDAAGQDMGPPAPVSGGDGHADVGRAGSATDPPGSGQPGRSEERGQEPADGSAVVF
ncbi:lytic transglycosylase domain-containing protein [Paraburkholderia sp. BCC1885]|uniref:lytic transglycosylase domain-containing protein n=1 Tax=Paraburkholderia sp. BCC1885 TaxID=2562669 RepID=UPI00118421D8|nr:lytic transglycosylase domain-containing protein [Paraburkholderia sp. BCC1885]